jgi:hypothetical protein
MISGRPRLRVLAAVYSLGQFLSKKGPEIPVGAAFTPRQRASNASTRGSEGEFHPVTRAHKRSKARPSCAFLSPLTPHLFSSVHCLLAGRIDCRRSNGGDYGRGERLGREGGLRGEFEVSRGARLKLSGGKKLDHNRSRSHST